MHLIVIVTETPNGLRYRRGGRTRLIYIIARKLAKRPANLRAIAPSGARFVGQLFAYITKYL